MSEGLIDRKAAIRAVLNRLLQVADATMRPHVGAHSFTPEEVAPVQACREESIEAIDGLIAVELAATPRMVGADRSAIEQTAAVERLSAEVARDVEAGVARDLEDQIEADGFLTADAAVLVFFRFAHLPPKLRAVSLDFADLAATIARKLPPSRERTKALDDLLRSKDAAVRAAL